MSTWAATVRDAFRTRLWPLPTIAVLVALLLGLGMPQLDAAIRDDLPSRVSGWLFGGGASAARDLLAAIASSMITVTALTFSLTVVTLQLASSQFSPRLLRTFARDLFVQVTLALFLATFTYALTVLRAVRAAEDGGGAGLVPSLAVTLAFVLAVASVVALVLFLGHLCEQIRVETMLGNVRREAAATVRSVLPARGPDDRGAAPSPPIPPSGARPLPAPGDGFLVRIDQDDLLALAVEEDVALRIEVHPGAFVVRETPLGRVWSAGLGQLSDEHAERIGDRVAGCVHLGLERTAAQDVGFGLRQLTDVAVKALSPGVNDPTTAVHALGHVSALLCDLSDRRLGPELLRDEEGRVRVTIDRPELAGYVDLALSQPRRYGAADPQVLQQIAQALLDLSHRVDPAQREVVRQQLARLSSSVAAQDFDQVERDDLEATAERIRRALDTTPSPGATAPADH